MNQGGWNLLSHNEHTNINGHKMVAMFTIDLVNGSEKERMLKVMKVMMGTNFKLNKLCGGKWWLNW
jgi:hypothetical protein